MILLRVQLSHFIDNPNGNQQSLVPLFPIMLFAQLTSVHRILYMYFIFIRIRRVPALQGQEVHGLQ